MVIDRSWWPSVSLYLTPLKSLVNGIIVSKNTSKNDIWTWRFLPDSFRHGLDAIIGQTLFPKYLKCEPMINLSFSKLWAHLIARCIRTYLPLQLLLTLTLGQFYLKIATLVFDTCCLAKTNLLFSKQFVIPHCTILYSPIKWKIYLS